MGEIKDELKDIKDLVKELQDEKKKTKKFRIPFGKKVGKSQAKKNYVTVVTLHENGHVDFVKRQISDQSFMEDGVPRLALGNYTWYYKKNPIIILPYWSVEPISKDYLVKTSLRDGGNTTGYKVLLDRMLREAVKSSQGFPNILKWIFGLGVGGIILYAFLTGGGA